MGVFVAHDVRVVCLGAEVRQTHQPEQGRLPEAQSVAQRPVGQTPEQHVHPVLGHDVHLVFVTHTRCFQEPKTETGKS